MKKLAILIVAMATLSLFFASVSIANVPAPPVNQTIGLPDVEFDGNTEADCRVCHAAGVPDLHHMLYGSSMPDGICSATTGECINSGNDGTECANADICDNSTGTAECEILPRDCYTDADCIVGIGICSNSGDPCNVSADCPRQYQNPECTTTPYCAGTSAAAKVPASQDNGGVYGCLTCHEESTSGGVTNFLVERDCMICHEQLPNSPSVHHLDEEQVKAKAGLCVTCHGDVVDDKDDGHAIPTYTPSLVTPGSVTTERQCTETGWGPVVPCTEDADCAGVSPTSTCPDELHKAETAEPGSCDYCHNSGLDTGSGLAIHDNYDTHHHTGVYKDRYGNTVDLGTGNSREICSWCHYTGYPHNPGAYDPIEIRTCENCHGMESLHSIQADSNGGGIVVGGETAGYGHVGEDTPGAGSDCWGCHGFSMAGASAPGSETLVPTISSGSVSVPAGVATPITITGNALEGASIELTAINGDIITVAADSSDATSLTATVNVPAGAYGMRAVNAGETSNVVGLIAIPDIAVTITSVSTSCGDCTGTVTITGSGFGAEIPAGVQEFMNVMQGTVELDIVSWTDTEIVATGAKCDGTPITVNGLYGSATK